MEKAFFFSEMVAVNEKLEVKEKVM